MGLAPAGPELSPLPCLAGTSLPPLLPQPCTIQYLVTHYLDISCVPRRSFFELLSYFSTNELEREKLQEFSSAQGQEELYSYCNRPRRTTLEVRLGAGQGCPIRADLGLKASRAPSAEEFNVLHPFYEVSMGFHQQLWIIVDSWVGSVLLWGAEGSGVGWWVLRGACVEPLAVPEDSQVASWGHQASPCWLCRRCGISLTPRMPSRPITCSTSSLASDPAPSPSPPPCW